MDPHSLLPSHNIKLEPACETADALNSAVTFQISHNENLTTLHTLQSASKEFADYIDSSAKRMVTEIPDFDKVDSKLPTGIKIEQPDLDVENPDQDRQTLCCSQTVSSLAMQEHAQLGDMLYSNRDLMFVKQEPSNDLCEDKRQLLDKITDCSNETIIDCSSNHETNVHSNVESIMTLNSYEANQESTIHWNIPDNESTVFEISTKQFLVDGGDKLRKIVGIKPIAIPCMTGVYVDRHINREKRKYTKGKPYKCDDCDSSFPSPSKLNIHKRQHTGERPYKCDDCGTSFNSSSNLKLHKRTHTGERPYKCDDCGASFNSTSDLKRHKRTHTGERPYKCADCDASFNSTSILKEHKRTHTGERPFKCHDCGASFNSTSHLNRHKRTHTGERPYKCHDCGASFTSAVRQKIHERTHTGERPYKCDDCSACFADSQILKTHKRTHTGERPFKCNDCDVSFAQAGTLTAHRRTHTGKTLQM